ncbi:cell division protein FtsW [Clostridium novyi B str. ATCC 27606]|uniref:Cell division protein FtsW n=2 Tax=Clostridium TaxID=1485 RepID=A0AA40M2L6_CLONO|nr:MULTISPECIES: FtsW/RodA/SpoVE family cell cycle protein [Clostridium]KEI13541.1 cell division protein FtsW [Clostridium novyi B str. NCTC 9691]KEI14825.1 cell division protein FtsW [Clostridium novyi B str. ATCC 27606]KEI16673.1 cell division protein FtsW [Clostridium haemolyticum NCTC 9693]KGN04132.1 cell division protein FtsW [Clostridium haemolyticum NCTC 8350]OOB76321.1 cell division protein FtsW [Clostridium haemolyticum]
MNSRRDEKKLLRFTYIFCLLCFLNLGILHWPKENFDKNAIIIGLIVCVLIAYAHFVIRKFFPDGDKYIQIFASILTIIGIVLLYRLKVDYAIRQIIWFTVGMVCFIMIVVLLPDLKRFAKYKYVYLVFTIILMAMGSLLGGRTHGARNWISIGGIVFQPSEFGKIFLVAYLASALRKYKNYKDLIQPAAVVMICLGFMVLQRDLGSALIFFGMSVTMLYIATSKFKYVATCLGLSALGSVMSYKMFGHVRVRVAIWKNVWADPTGEGMQVVQSMIAIASGGLFGTGLGQGHPGFIPVRESDFIFAVLSEEMGGIMAFGVIILYFLLFYRCMRAAVYIDDKFSALLAVGYSAMIATQVLVIVGGVVNMIPLTGITLPLISYGGSSMVTTFFALGILQKISEEGTAIE